MLSTFSLLSMSNLALSSPTIGSINVVFGYYDDWIYLMFGIGAIALFLSWARIHANQGLRRMEVWLFILMALWGASGFFFLRLFTQFISFPKNKLFENLSNALEIFYVPIPDWDSYLFGWAQQCCGFLRPRSAIFSSILLPMAALLILVVLALFFLRFYIHKADYLTFIRDGALGLSIGISANLCADLLIKLVFFKSTNVMISNWNQISSIAWILSNILLGYFIPVLLVKRISRVEREINQFSNRNAL